MGLAVLALVLIPLVVWLAANPVVRVQTPQGTLVLNFPEGIPADLEVLVDGEKVKVKNLDKDHKQVDIAVGDRLIEVRDGEKLLQREPKVAIASGKKTVLTVEIDRGKKVGLVEPPRQPREEELVELGNMSGLLGRPNRLHFSPDGKLAVSTSRPSIDPFINSVAVWDLDRRTRVGKVHQPAAGDAILCPLGCLLDPIALKVVVWSPLIDKEEKFPLAPSSYVSCFALSPTKIQVAAAGGDGIAEVWNLKPIRKHRAFTHGKCIYHTTYSSDAHFLLTGGDDAVVRIWDVEKDRQEHSYETPLAKANRHSWSRLACRPTASELRLSPW